VKRIDPIKDTEALAQHMADASREVRLLVWTENKKQERRYLPATTEFAATHPEYHVVERYEPVYRAPDPAARPL
jgi:hypothetical protein